MGRNRRVLARVMHEIAALRGAPPGTVVDKTGGLEVSWSLHFRASGFQVAARILIIEDNPTNMELMSYLLTAFGHTPLMAFDGESGVRMAREDGPT